MIPLLLLLLVPPPTNFRIADPVTVYDSAFCAHVRDYWIGWYDGRVQDRQSGLWVTDAADLARSEQCARHDDNDGVDLGRFVR